MPCSDELCMNRSDNLEASPLFRQKCVIKQYFSISQQNICCGYPIELSERDGSLEHPKHFFNIWIRK